MVIGIKELLRLVKENNLIENLCDREIKNPEGSGFDLRMGEVYKLKGGGFIGLEKRKTPDSELLSKYDPEKSEEFFTFKPNEYYLVKTIEKVNLPIDMNAVIFPRTTIFRSGLGFFNGVVNPGYSGELVFAICNFGKEDIKISLGARISHIIFNRIEGEGSAYRGQWQGGRVTTKNKEKQV